MAKLTEQRMFRFTPAQLARLLELAAQTNSVAKTGLNARQPSIAAMIARIADGEVLVSERNPWSLPHGLAEQADAVERRERLEQAKPQRKTPAVKLEQLPMELEPA